MFSETNKIEQAEDFTKKYNFSQEKGNEVEEINFKILFEFLIDKKMIPIAILRYVNDIGHKFVFMAPPPETIININSRKFIIIFMLLKPF